MAATLDGGVVVEVDGIAGYSDDIAQLATFGPEFIGHFGQGYAVGEDIELGLGESLAQCCHGVGQARVEQGLSADEVGMADFAVGDAAQMVHGAGKLVEVGEFFGCQGRVVGTAFAVEVAIVGKHEFQS